jgi:hypothetical protein
VLAFRNSEAQGEHLQRKHLDAWINDPPSCAWDEMGQKVATQLGANWGIGSTISAKNARRNRRGRDYRADLDLIFANPNGRAFRPDSISAAVSALCRRLKLPTGASLHTLATAPDRTSWPRAYRCRQRQSDWVTHLCG